MEKLTATLPRGMSLTDLALRFILSSDDVDVVIPGMRKPAHVLANVNASDAGALPPELLRELRSHRWDRAPTTWSH
ncbi:Aldo/keto reductase family protein [compost metagenome]